MKTVDQVITRFRRHYPACDATTALDLLQTAYKRLLDKARIRVAEVTFSSIVDGTREYTWAEADLRVYSVTWYKSATDFWPLVPVSEDQLTDRNPSWKNATDEGDPDSFYIAARTDATSNKTGKLVIGFDVIPDTTTTGGYPKAVCQCEQYAAISGSTEIPYSLLDEMYLVYAMCELWACEEDIQKATFWERKRTQEESIQIEHLKQSSVNNEPTTILPPYGPFSRRVQ